MSWANVLLIKVYNAEFRMLPRQNITLFFKRKEEVDFTEMVIKTIDWDKRNEYLIKRWHPDYLYLVFLDLGDQTIWCLFISLEQ